MLSIAIGLELNSALVSFQNFQNKPFSNEFEIVFILITKRWTTFIAAPPKIASFDFGEEPSNFGDSASVQCLVTSGDLPVEFQWFFNGHSVSEFPGITTAKMGKRNSVLTIDSVTGKHAGNFTCLASNLASLVNFTAALIVNGIFQLAFQFQSMSRIACSYFCSYFILSVSSEYPVLKIHSIDAERIKYQ